MHNNSFDKMQKRAISLGFLVIFGEFLFLSVCVYILGAEPTPILS